MMEKRTLLAVALSFLVFMGWQTFFLEKPQPVDASASATPSATPSKPKPVQVSQAQAKKASSSSSESAIIGKKTKDENPPRMEFSLLESKVTLTSEANFFSDWVSDHYLFNYEETDASTGESVDKSRPVDLQAVMNSPYGVFLMFENQNSVDPAERWGPYAYLGSVQGELKQEGNRVTWTYEDDLVRMERTAVLSEARPYVDMEIKTEFKKKPPTHVYLAIQANKPPQSSPALSDPDTDPEIQDRQISFYTREEVDRYLLDDLEDVFDDDDADRIRAKRLYGVLPRGNSPTKWMAAQSQYFTLAVVATGEFLPKHWMKPNVVRSAQGFSGDIGVTGALMYTINKNKAQFPIRVYMGPKKAALLDRVEPSLSQAIDLGFFKVFAYPLLEALKWFNRYFDNYGIAIIIVTFLLRVLLIPLNYKSMKSMRKMAELSPELQKLREKYKDDPQKMNQEVMLFMRSKGYNPIAGCLPMLAQMPIFFAMFQVLRTSVELYQAPFALWITDLSKMDPYFVTPVLSTLIMVAQQKLTPTPQAADPMQQKILQFMPVMFGAFMITMPAGLNIYILTSTLVGVVQQYVINKKLGMSGGAAGVTPQPNASST